MPRKAGQRCAMPRKAGIDDFLLDIRDCLAGPLDEQTGYRYFDQHEDKAFSLLWEQLKVHLAEWASTANGIDLKWAKQQAEKYNRRVGKEGCFSQVSQLVSDCAPSPPRQ